jgi:F-type H+-transporting ATPase subunit gamma
MPSTIDIDRKLKTFTSVGDIVSAMKAYAGMTVRRTEELVPNVREYEETVIAALGDAVRLIGIDLPERTGSGERLLIAFGSSQGLCGPYNEHVARRVAEEKKANDTLFVIGSRLRGSIESHGVTIEVSADAPASISGIGKALEDTIVSIIEIYRGELFYDMVLIFTAVREHKADVVLEQVLPPDRDRVAAHKSAHPPETYMEGQLILDAVLEEFLYISLFRGYLESLMSENWHRLNVLDGATTSLERRLRELRILKNYIRQEEITEEMLEILGGGRFFG